MYINSSVKVLREPFLEQWRGIRSCCCLFCGEDLLVNPELKARTSVAGSFVLWPVKKADTKEKQKKSKSDKHIKISSDVCKINKDLLRPFVGRSEGDDLKALRAVRFLEQLLTALNDAWEAL